jgi:formylglycine-generating enzyme required for sulfatase activity
LIENPDSVVPYDAGVVVVQATVSDFRLDTYESTVGRFRTFVEDSAGHQLPDGSGKNPNSPNDEGWVSRWNSSLPSIDDRAKLDNDLNCNGQGTWTEDEGKNDSLPINCITQLEAFAFCIWDGGRLPTEAEWHYAAEGGSEQRGYPWSTPGTTGAIDPSYAVYAPSPFVATVGSTAPRGNGRWGQADLAGNVAEWLRDGSQTRFVAETYYPASCIDCIGGSKRGGQTGGGSFLSTARSVRATTRADAVLSARLPGLGVRCARAAS